MSVPVMAQACPEDERRLPKRDRGIAQWFMTSRSEINRARYWVMSLRLARMCACCGVWCVHVDFLYMSTSTLGQIIMKKG